MADKIWYRTNFDVAANDTLTANAVALGQEQYFATRPVFSITSMLKPRDFRNRYLFTLTVPNATVLSLLQLRFWVGTGIVGSAITNGVLVGDTGAFGLGNLVSLVNSPMYLEQNAHLVTVGTAGSSLLNVYTSGATSMGNGKPKIDMSTPLVSTTAMSCATQQTLFIGLTCTVALTAGITMTLQDFIPEYTD